MPTDDELNPDLMLQITATDLLVKAANKEIDLDRLARQELAARGLDTKGNWIGHKAAREAFSASVLAKEAETKQREDRLLELGADAARKIIARRGIRQQRDIMLDQQELKLLIQEGYIRGYEDAG